MILFGVFALCAGSLIFFLPETYNKELPDHIADAVNINTDAEVGTEQSRSKKQ